MKLARRLEGAGFSREQADGTAAALAETLTAEIATKRDLADLKAELKGDIAELRLEMRTGFASVQTEFGSVRNEMASLRAELHSEVAGLRGENAGLRGEIAGVRTDTAKWIIGAVFINTVTAVGLVAAVWQFFRR